MSHYVISDLHGERDRFHRLLKDIHFSTDDTLYILGDIVDRGPEPIPLLLEILDTPNMILLLGNHEYMCLQYYAPNATDLDRRRWDRNNNIPTKAGLAELNDLERQELFRRLYALPVHIRVNVNGQDFYLVHGFPAETVHDEVWNRPLPDTPAPIPGVQVIVGHTPVSAIGRNDEEEAAYNRALAARGETLKIYHAPGYIDIDCSCGYDIPTKKLACLRLEDLAEFYS